MKRRILTALILSGITALHTSAFADNADLLKRINDHSTIIIGTEGTYPPFTYHDADGKLTGYDVEVSRAIADKLGVKAVFRETPWNALLAGLNNNRFDAVANQVSMSSPERREKYESSTPYSYSGIALAISPKRPNIQSLDNLTGLTGGLAFTSNFADLVRQHGAKVEPVEGGLAQEMALVAQGRVDFTLNDRLAVLYYKKNMPKDSLRVISLPQEGKFSAGLILRKGQHAAVEKINTALNALRADGTIARISRQFFGEDVSQE